MFIHVGSQWSVIHIASSLIAFAGFAAAFVACVGCIVQERMLKLKRVNSIQQRLPPLGSAERTAYKMAAFGFTMLTLGMVAGLLQSQTTTGSFWHWDVGRTWSLVTWLVYAAYLHVRGINGWRGKWTNRLLVAGFACALMALVGMPSG